MTDGLKGDSRVFLRFEIECNVYGTLLLAST